MDIQHENMSGVHIKWALDASTSTRQKCEQESYQYNIDGLSIPVVLGDYISIQIGMLRDNNQSDIETKASACYIQGNISNSLLLNYCL